MNYEDYEGFIFVTTYSEKSNKSIPYLNKYFYELKTLFREKLKPCKKSLREVAKYIEEMLEVTLLSDNDHRHKIILDYWAQTDELLYGKKIKSEYKIFGYEVLRTSRNIKYYSDNIGSDNIYIIFSEENDRIYCHNKKLNDEIDLYRGIDEYDIENDTEQLLRYLFLLQNNN